MIRREIILLLLGSAFLSCSQDEFKPEELPLSFEVVAEYPHYVIANDLDGDGTDELITIAPSTTYGTAEYPLGFIWIITLEGKFDDQVNFPGFILTPLHFLDWDHDGQLEVLVPYLRHDSLFVSFVNAKSQKLFSFFLISGQPRKEEKAEFPWDPFLQHFHLTDADHDGQEELVTVISTGYARLPRGILIHSLPEGKLLGKVIVGACISSGDFGDFDQDGIEEFCGAGAAVNNGASAGGFDDQHAYFVNFDLSLPPKVTWSRNSGKNHSYIHYEDFDNDGKKEFLAVTSGGILNTSRKTKLELITPGTWKTYQERVVNEALIFPIIMDLENDLKPEILLLHSQGEIWVFNNKFEITQQRKIANKILGHFKVPDIDGDGFEEIYVATTSQAILLGPDLEIKAVSEKFGLTNPVNRGVGKKPYLLSPTTDHNSKLIKTYLLSPKENRFYLWYRHKAMVFWFTGSSAVIGLSLLLFSWHRRNHLMAKLQDFVFDSDNRGLMFVKPNGRVLFHNARLNYFINSPAEQHFVGRHFSEIISHSQLLAFLRTALQSPYHHHEIPVALDAEQLDHTIQVIVDPVFVKGSDQPHWLVQFWDKSLELEFHKAKTWGMMAQRVAHDIKNPLTAIQLTLQRLQMEYREQAAGEVSRRYDEYTNRIMERIDALRLLTRNFMKFIDLEKPHLVDTPLQPFLQTIAENLFKNLPPDVALQLRLKAGEVTLGIDQDQMKVLLENLIANAVNAMPAGGKITLAASRTEKLRLAQNGYEPRDYIVVEVSDTGIGMPADILDKIFEPGFSASQHGTGLGLAMVKKIVESHRGYIEVESEEGLGTVFSVYLSMQ